MEPVTFAAGATALAGLGFAWRMCRRVRLAERQAADLRVEVENERYAASCDPLTGLANRRTFQRVGSALLADPTRYPLLAVVIDLDDFKWINDRYGHAVGDQVLITAGRRFARCAGDNLVARLGGDEFAGLLTPAQVGQDQLQLLNHRLSELIAAPIPVADRTLRVTASIGLVQLRCRTQLTEALAYADAAMYQAKLSGPQES